MGIKTLQPVDPVIRLAQLVHAPTDDRWLHAPPDEKSRFWTVVARVAMRVFDEQCAAGLDRHGKPMKPVIMKDRPKYANGQRLSGPPLTPHRALSRTRRLLDFRAGPNGATLFWRDGWGVILSYHAAGIQHNPILPIRDVLGISPAGIKRVQEAADDYWRTGDVPEDARGDSLTRGGISVDLPWSAGAGPSPNVSRGVTLPPGYTPKSVVMGPSIGRSESTGATVSPWSKHVYGTRAKSTPRPMPKPKPAPIPKPLAPAPQPAAKPKYAPEVVETLAKIPPVASTTERGEPFIVATADAWAKTGGGVFRAAYDDLAKRYHETDPDRLPLAAITSGSNIYLINQKHPFWSDPDALAKQYHTQGLFSSPSRNHVFNHELGHRLHYLNIGKQEFDSLLSQVWIDAADKLIAARVSAYATVTPQEFVAETFAGLRHGIIYDADVVALYEKLGGVIP